MIDPVATLFAVIYFFGIALHYIHLKSIMYLTDNLDKADWPRIYWYSIVWPYLQCQYFFSLVFDRDEDDDEEDY